MTMTHYRHFRRQWTRHLPFHRTRHLPFHRTLNLPFHRCPPHVTAPSACTTRPTSADSTSRSPKTWMTSQPPPPKSPRSSHRLRSMVTAAGPSTQRPDRRVNPRGSLPERARVPVTWEPCSGQLGLSKSQCAEDANLMIAVCEIPIIHPDETYVLY